MPRGQYKRRVKTTNTESEILSSEVTEASVGPTHTVYKIVIHYLFVSKEFESRDVMEVFTIYDTNARDAQLAATRVGERGLLIDRMNEDETALFIPPHRIRQVNITKMEIPNAK